MPNQDLADVAAEPKADIVDEHCRRPGGGEPALAQLFLPVHPADRQQSHELDRSAEDH